MRLAFLTLWALLLFHSLSANAGTVTIDRVENASNFVKGTNATDAPIIYGAAAGLQANCNTLNAESFCNNCVGTNACSQKRVHENLMLRIYFTVTTENKGAIFFGKYDGGTPTDWTGLYTRSTNSTELTKGSTGYIQVAWGTLCEGLGGTRNCEQVSSTVTNFFIAISPDNVIAPEELTQFPIRVFAPGGNDPLVIDDITCGDNKAGACSFLVFPGDEKVYIDEIEPGGSYPLSENVPIQALRFYFTNIPGDDINNLNYASPAYADLAIDDTGKPVPDKIEGLENGVIYGFKVATIDAAFNIAYLTSAAQITADCGANTIITDASVGNCPFITRPSKVLGLLPEDVNCFISTAAYGSSMAEKVRTFRQFRNRILLPTKAGLEFVKAYYNYGPKVAKLIIDYPALKPVVRAALWPASVFATLSLEFGFGTVAIAFAFFSIFIAGIIIWGIIKCAPQQRSV